MSRLQKLRIATALLVTLIIVSGLVGEIKYGVLCSPDVWQFAVTDPMGFVLRTLGLWRVSLNATCPLGFLERALAAWAVLPQWFSVAFVVLSVILLGRVFCAWVCPTVLFKRWGSGKGGSRFHQETMPQGGIWSSYSSYAILGGVLLTSILFRFPVFCLFCPIGLFFGALYAVLRVFTPEALSLELLVFPLMLGLELWFLKSWCRSICPLGALLSIISSFNRFFLPTVSKDKCLNAKGINCQVCTRVCPEGIDLTRTSRRFLPNSCTKCLECSERCPEKAIKFPLRA